MRPCRRRPCPTGSPSPPPPPDRARTRWSQAPGGELPQLYAGASAFVFLSEYEGFGLTPLEAMASGVPLVMLDTPVAREVCGDAATYISRPDPDLLAGALQAALFDVEERQRMVNAASQ